MKAQAEWGGPDRVAAIFLATSLAAHGTEAAAEFDGGLEIEFTEEDEFEENGSEEILSTSEPGRRAGVSLSYALVGDDGQLQADNGQPLLIPVGFATRVLCGIANDGNTAVNVSQVVVAARPLILNEDNLSYEVGPVPIGAVVASGSELSVLVSVLLPENREKMRARVELTLEYSDRVGGKMYADSFFNRTIEFLPADLTAEMWNASVAVSVLLSLLIAAFLGRVFLASATAAQQPAPSTEARRKSKRNA